MLKWSSKLVFWIILAKTELKMNDQGKAASEVQKQSWRRLYRAIVSALTDEAKPRVLVTSAPISQPRSEENPVLCLVVPLGLLEYLHFPWER